MNRALPSRCTMAPLSVLRVPAAIALMVALFAAPVSMPASAAAAPPAPWFSTNVIVNGLPAYGGSQPSLAVGPTGTLYVAYGAWGGPTTQSDVFFSKSADGGRTWTDPVRVNNDAGGASQSRPSLVLDATESIYVLWTDTRGGTMDVYFAKSTNGGLSFPPSARVNNDATAAEQARPSVAVASDRSVYAVWDDPRGA